MNKNSQKKRIINKEMFKKDMDKRARILINKLYVLFGFILVFSIFLGSVSATGWNSTFEDGLYMYYAFEGGSVAIDNVTSMLHNGTFTGSASNTLTGKIGKGVDFTTENGDYITVSTALDMDASWTMNVWLYGEWGARGYWADRASGNAYYASTDASGLIMFYSWTLGCGCSSAGGALSTTTYKMWTVKYNQSYIQCLLNNVPVETNACTGSASSNTNWVLGYDGTNPTSYDWNGGMDEFGFWNRSLTASEITTLYNDGDGITYRGSSADTTSPAVVFDSQIPSDITSINAINNPINITYNISDASALNESAINIYFKSNSTTRNILTFINGSAIEQWQKHNQTSNSSNKFLFRLKDHEVYPGVYNLYENLTENIVHTLQTLTGTNNKVSIEFLNVTNSTQYNFFEIMSNSTSIQRIYYCNSSYGFNGAITISPFCSQISTIGINQSYNHSETIYSSHQIVDFFINTTTGKTLGGVSVTPTSYFILRGNAGVLNVINYWTVPNISRTGAIKTTTNTGNSWTNQTYTVDAHLHQFSGASSLYYYICANDTATPNNQNCTSIRNDLYELGGLPPTSPILSSPINISYEILGKLFINYSSAVSPNGYAISKYTIDLLNADFTQNKTLLDENTTVLGYIWDTSSEIQGQYRILINATDNMSQVSHGYSFIFTLTDITPPNISSIVWKTTGGFTSEKLFYNQVIDYINVTANDAGRIIPVYLDVYDPDNIKVIDNQSMTNDTTTMYNYSNDIILSKSGNWTLNCTTYDSFGNMNYTTKVLNVTLNAQSLRDGWYGYSAKTILNSSEITRLTTYGYDLFELQDNFSTAKSNFADMLDSINNSRNSNVKIGINYILDFNTSNTALRDSYLANLSANFTKLNTVPYTDTVVYISLEMVNMSDYTDVELGNALNIIASNITNAIDAEFPIFSKNYTNNSRLDGAYISYSSNMIYLTPTSELSFIDQQKNLFKTSSSLTRIYVEIVDSIKSVVEVFHRLIIDSLRGTPATIDININVSVLSNNDIIIFNNGSTSANFTVNVSTLGVIGKDAWDSTNKKIIEMNIGDDGEIIVEVAAYNASVIYFDDFDHIQMDSLSSGLLYKGATSEKVESNYTNSSTGWSDLFDIAGADDIQIELPDPSYTRNQFVTFYGWLNASVIDTPDWNKYDIVILADHNNAELDALNYSAGTDFYGYISVADYNNSIEWTNSKNGEVDAWLALNDSLNIFIDGFDIGMPGANFTSRAKELVDYVQVTKKRLAILNTYTAYQSFATWGKGGVMKESCVNRWNGVSAGLPSSFTRENWTLELQKSTWYKAHNVNVLCQAFDNRSLDGTNLILNYTELQNIYFASKVLGYDNFYLSQPDFNYAHDERIYDVGNNLDRTYHQLTTDANTYYRTYEKGIIYYNTTSGQGWIEDGKTINEMKVCFYMYNPAVQGGAFNFNINKRDSTGSVGEYSYTKDWASGTWKWICVDTTGETPINGMYLIEGWFGVHTTTPAQGVQLGNNISVGTGVHSWWDVSSTDSFTSYAADKNWMVNISINQSNRISIDTTNLINQYEINSTIPGKYLNVSINSTYDFPIEVWSKPIIVPHFKNISFLNSSEMWVVLNYTNTSNCDSGNPTWSSNAIEGETFKACIENNAVGTLVRVTAPTLSNRDYQIDEADVTPPTFATIPANASLFYFNETFGVTFVGTDDILFDTYTINDTKFNINSTGFLINSSPIAVGNYAINVTINDSSNNINWTIYTLQIKKSMDSCNIYFNVSSPITYPTTFIVYNNCSSAYSIYRNDTSITNASIISSGAGYYNFTVQRTDTTNYTNIVDSQFFTVNKATSVVYTYINNSRANISVGDGTTIWLNSSLITGELGTLSLSINTTVLNSSIADKILNNSYKFNTVGFYNISTQLTGSQNYTDSNEIFNVTVTDSTKPIVQIIFPENTTYNFNVTNITYNVIETNPEYCWYSRNESLVNSTLSTYGNNFTMLLFSENFNTWKIWCNDTSNNIGTANVSFSLNILPTTGGSVDTSGNNGGTYDLPYIMTLDHINITWDNFYFNQTNYIYILPLDINDTIVNATNISANIISKIVYNSSSIQKLIDGRYRKSFDIISTNITEFEVEITVTQNLKQLKKTVIISVMEKPTLIDKLTADNIWTFFKNNWFFLLMGAVILFVIFGLIFMDRRK